MNKKLSVSKEIAEIVANDIENSCECETATTFCYTDVKKYRTEHDAVVTIVRTTEKELVSISIGEEENTEVLFHF